MVDFNRSGYTDRAVHIDNWDEFSWIGIEAENTDRTCTSAYAFDPVSASSTSASSGIIGLSSPGYWPFHTQFPKLSAREIFEGFLSAWPGYPASPRQIFKLLQGDVDKEA